MFADFLGLDSLIDVQTFGSTSSNGDNSRHLLFLILETLQPKCPRIIPLSLCTNCCACSSVIRLMNEFGRMGCINEFKITKMRTFIGFILQIEHIKLPFHT